jgi:hypothetical protein
VGVVAATRDVATLGQLLVHLGALGRLLRAQLLPLLLLELLEVAGAARALVLLERVCAQEDGACVLE